MAYVLVNRSLHTPTTRLILRYLVENPGPQSYLEIAVAVQTGYWHTRRICLNLVESGHLIKSKRGRSPVFAIAAPAAKEGDL